jgi:hypothetical protein
LNKELDFIFFFMCSTLAFSSDIQAGNGFLLAAGWQPLLLLLLLSRLNC